ncbi:hypothetical protein BC749_10492 [Flavobacterium araucananum]|uniref:DNA-binding protein n=1 Tax=Flavobacterium araucananum TaxID=946678 RepID=A0A227NVA6_9FLAO|nr:hypothetical protein [Flavobacterium araucananum]OXG01559.1 hypothetical protein B0A64_19030 [Flavobacterium araucananum]PWJ98946.1 hypothetical protein BC749_10492 [Flavobacterium araucananum]
MNFIKQIERIKRIHKLISSEQTGTPSMFARKLCLSRSQLYNELEVIKEFDGPVKYCKKRESFYYETSFELIVHFSLKTIKDDESIEIFGGSNFRPIILDGSLISLL